MTKMPALMAAICGGADYCDEAGSVFAIHPELCGSAELAADQQTDGCRVYF